MEGRDCGHLEPFVLHVGCKPGHRTKLYGLVLNDLGILRPQTQLAQQVACEDGALNPGAQLGSSSRFLSQSLSPRTTSPSPRSRWNHDGATQKLYDGLHHKLTNNAQFGKDMEVPRFASVSRAANLRKGTVRAVTVQEVLPKPHRDVHTVRIGRHELDVSVERQVPHDSARSDRLS